MATHTGAEITVRLLERQGITTVTGIPGGPILPIYDALAESQAITHVLARHEQGAGFIAQGMARVTGKPAVCIASSGPGATNLMTAIADAKLDSIPLIAITGQVPLSMIGTDAFQEVDTYGLSIPITKHNFLVKSVEELLTIIPEAFRIASSGRPGPVLIDIPKDVQTQQHTIDEWPQPALRETSAEPLSTELEQAAKMIGHAQRPVLYLGGGVIHSDAARSAQQLAEKSSIPTVMTLMGLGAMAVDHPLSMGMLGMHAARYTNMALHECDLLIVVGARLDDRATGKIEQFCPDAKLIHIDIDPSELGKLKSAQLAITGDAETLLESLLPHIASQQRPVWIQRINHLRQHYPLVMPDRNNVRSHFGLINAVANCVDDEAVIVTDVGQHQMWVAQAYPLRRPRQWLTSGGLGTMGFGLPAAIGAALAQPERTVICFSGDGSILMNIQELATAAELNVNIKLIVMNNQSLGLVHQQQTLFYGRRTFASQYHAVPDFITVALGFGIQAVDLDNQANPAKALQQALLQRGPCLIHASVDVAQHVLPMVPPGAANIDMIGA